MKHEPVNDDIDFLEEIVELSSTAPLRQSRPQRLIEWPEFMKMRCQVARDGLKEKIRNEAKLGLYGFVPSVPLYSFDFENRPFYRRPELSDVKSPPFKDFVEYVHGLGFSCFIDRPGLTTWFSKDRKKSSPEVHLNDFGLYVFQYFDSIGAPEPQRYAPSQVHWALYILIPGQEVPNFSLRRYFRYNHDPLSISIIFLKVFVAFALPTMIIAPFFIMFLDTAAPPFEHREESNELRESVENDK